MKRKILFFMAVIVLAFIWGHSMIPENKSASESIWFTNKIFDPLFRCFGLETIDKDVVRKMAHVFEFFILSIFTAIYWKGRVVRSIYTGFTIAFLDETIQVLTKRGALITDIWIDMIGVGIGTAIGCVVWNMRNLK